MRLVPPFEASSAEGVIHAARARFVTRVWRIHHTWGLVLDLRTRIPIGPRGRTFVGEEWVRSIVRIDVFCGNLTRCRTKSAITSNSLLSGRTRRRTSLKSHACFHACSISFEGPLWCRRTGRRAALKSHARLHTRCIGLNSIL